MPALQNPRHEIFAKWVAKGSSLREAYLKAGYSPTNDNALDACASRLLSDARVCYRVTEIQEAAAKRMEVTIAKLTEKLMNLAEVSEQTGVTKDEGGNVHDSSPQHLNVARATYMDVAKLNGLVVDKQQSTAEVTVTEIRRTIVDPQAK